MQRSLVFATTTPGTIWNPVAKLTKADPHVVYMGRNQGPFKCGNCDYFSAPSRCDNVKGPIDMEGCCNLFTRREVKPRIMTHSDLKWLEL